MNKIVQIITSLLTTLLIIIIIIIVIIWVVYYTNPKKCSKIYNDKWYTNSNINTWEVSTYENFQSIENDYSFWKSFIKELEPLSKYKIKEINNDNVAKTMFKELLFPNVQFNKNESSDYKELIWKENGNIQIISPRNVTADIKWLKSNIINKSSFVFIISKSKFYVEEIAGCLIYGLLLDGNEINLNHNGKKETFQNNGKGFIFRSDVELELDSQSKILLIHFIPKSKNIWDKINFPISKIMHKTDQYKNNK